MYRIHLFICLWTLQVNSIALKGPVLPYFENVPCELGLIHFTKVTDLTWKGEVNLEADPELYYNFGDLEFEIEFKNEISFFWIETRSLTFKNNFHNVIFKLKDEFPKNFHVYLPKNCSTPEVPVVTSFKLNNMTMCNDLASAPKTEESLNITEKNNNNFHNCGRRPMKEGKVTLIRTEAKSGDWPWHAVILFRHYVNKIRCGGSIISRTAILTVGHCMTYNNQLVPAQNCYVIAGGNDLRNTNQIGAQTRNAKRIILHPNFSMMNAASNLAIVIVNELYYTPYVQPICIGESMRESDKTTLFGKRAMFAGFGKTEQYVLSDVLLSTDVIIQNDTTCHMFPRERLNEFSFCGAYGPCVGDAGGGLAIPRYQSDHKVSWFLRGVFSFCRVNAISRICDSESYVIFTDVAPHYSWIYQHAGLECVENIY